MVRFLLACGLSVATMSAATAQSVNITEDMADASYSVNGQNFSITRAHNPDHHLNGEYTKTSRECPPFCVHPMVAAPGVETMGELELINFLRGTVHDGEGLLLDARLPDWFAKATVPGAINVPFSTLEPTNSYRDDILVALGAAKAGNGLDFSNALDLAIFGNGPWDDQAQRAVRNLIAAGYPAAKIHYYRGGMQMWLLLGLTHDVPKG